MILAVTFDKDGKELARKGVAVDPPAPDLPRHGGKKPPVDLDLTLDPNPQAVRARMVVRDEFTGHMGTVDLPLKPGAAASSVTQEEDAESTGAPAPKPPASASVPVS